MLICFKENHPFLMLILNSFPHALLSVDFITSSCLLPDIPFEYHLSRLCFCCSRGHLKPPLGPYMVAIGLLHIL